MMTRIRIAMTSNDGRLPVLVDDRMQPLPLPLRYVMDGLYLNEAWRSIENRLRAIGFLYRFFSRHGVDLDERLRSTTIFGIDELKRFFLWLEIKDRENPAMDPVITDLVAKETFNNYVSYVGDYVAWAVLHYRGRYDTGPRRGEAAAKDAETIRNLILESRRSGKSQKRQSGLTEEQERRLIKIIRPGHPDNPFRPSKQFANGVLTRYLLETGVRAGELMYTRVSDMDLWGTSPEIRVEQRENFGKEPRRRAPSVKTYDRILPISPNLAEDLAVYERKIRGRVSHLYAFITPRDRQPILAGNITRISFPIISMCWCGCRRSMCPAMPNYCAATSGCIPSQPCIKPRGWKL
jgi:integrase